MKIGIIGAGRVGCSIGKYLRTKDIELAGYYDVDSVAAKEAAEFTRTESFDSLKQLVDQITDYIYHHTGFIYYTGLGTIKRAVSKESDYMSLQWRIIIRFIFRKGEHERIMLFNSSNVTVQ